ncbi:MAG: hypothetical protein FGM52_15855 [Mycobacterium sp.]|nr:hypothetical protein [Mycobacterium sp.]
MPSALAKALPGSVKAVHIWPQSMRPNGPRPRPWQPTKTVEMHLSNAYRKLGIRSRVHLADKLRTSDLGPDR